MTVNSDTSITVTSPAGSAGTVHITVTTPGGTSTTSSADQFTYVPPPTFTSITPNSGSTAGGTAVTIVGTGFFTGTSLAVTIGGNAATGVSVTDATHIAATTPAHAAGAVWVNITNGDGQFVNTTGAYTYVVPSVSITLNKNSINLALIPGSSATDTSLGIIVSANLPFAVTVADNTGRPSGTQGYLGNFTSSYQGSPLDTTLSITSWVGRNHERDYKCGDYYPANISRRVNTLYRKCSGHQPAPRFQYLQPAGCIF